MAQRLLFFGNERLATGTTTSVPTLQALLDAGYEIGAVILAQNNLQASRKVRETEIVQLARLNNIPVLTPEKLSDARDELAAYGAEAAILVAYGKLVPQSIIDLFPRGIINIHPSLLPKHRGSIPIEAAILDDEAETGVSLMKLVAAMDAGPVYAQTESFIIDSRFSKQRVCDILASDATELLIDKLPAILNGQLEAIEQDDTDATYDSRIQKEDGSIDWGKSASRLEREIRAYAGWPRSRTKIADRDVIITQATVVDKTGTAGTLDTGENTLLFYCGEGALQIESLIPAGKKEMPGSAFIAGYGPF